MVSADQRLAEIVAALGDVGLTCLVMGGHAVRFYGLHRHTDDFDLCLAPDHWDELDSRLATSRLFAGQRLIEGSSWRPSAFRRFQLDRLEDGRELRLEFWRENHLLAPFSELHARRETGTYGGCELSFLSLADLIRSKETQRDKDWRDIDVLEEFLGERLASRVQRGEANVSDALTQIRNRRGIESFLRANLLSDRAAVSAAIERAPSGIVPACLLPFAPNAICPAFPGILEPVVERRLRRTPPLDAVHLALLEAVRRRYMQRAQAIDKADKEKIWAANVAESIRENDSPT